MNKYELASLSKKEFKYINISNSNWDEHCVSIGNDVHLDIDVEVLLTIMKSETDSAGSEIKISAIEIDSISDSSYCPYCPDYDEEDDDV